MWKVLLVISAVVLAGAGYLSWDNHNEKKAKDAELASTQKTLEDRLASLEATNAEIAQLEMSIQMLNDETEALETEKIDLDAKVVEAESNLRAQESKLKTDSERLEKAKTMVGSIALEIPEAIDIRPFGRIIAALGGRKLDVEKYTGHTLRALALEHIVG